jgi:nucleotide-binding universal stress UspA family protein
MAGKTILLCDDFVGDGNHDKQRSKVLRKFANDLGDRMKTSSRIITVLDIPPKMLGSNKVKPQDPLVDILYGHPVQLILQESRKPKIEMLVMGTRARSGFKRTLLGSVAEETIRNVSVPVAVLGAKAVEADFRLSSSKALKVLVVSGLDVASGPAERFAAKFAKRIGAEVILFHSVGDQIRHMKDMLYSQRVTSASIEKIFDEMKEFAEESVARKIKAYKAQGLEVSGYIAYEETEVIKSLKKKKWFGADLVVMGSHSRGRFLKAFLGSSVRRAILSAECPVIVVRS